MPSSTAAGRRPTMKKSVKELKQKPNTTTLIQEIRFLLERITMSPKLVDYPCEVDNEEPKAKDSTTKAKAEGPKAKAKAKDAPAVRWDVVADVHRYVLMTLIERLKDHNSEIPWDKIAKSIHPNMTGNAASQHFSKVKRQMIERGEIVPPGPLFDVDRPQPKPATKKDLSAYSTPNTTTAAVANKRPRRNATLNNHYTYDGDSTDEWEGVDPAEGDPDDEFELSPPKKRSTVKSKAKLSSSEGNTKKTPEELVREFGLHDARSAIAILRINSNKLKEFRTMEENAAKLKAAAENVPNETVSKGSISSQMIPANWVDEDGSNIHLKDGTNHPFATATKEGLPGATAQNSPTESAKDTTLGNATNVQHSVSNNELAWITPAATNDGMISDRFSSYYNTSLALDRGSNTLFTEYQVATEHNHLPNFTFPAPTTFVTNAATTSYPQVSDMTTAMQFPDYNTQYASSFSCLPPSYGQEMRIAPNPGETHISPSTSLGSTAVSSFDGDSDTPPNAYGHIMNWSDERMMLESQILDPEAAFVVTNNALASMNVASDEYSPTDSEEFNPLVSNFPDYYTADGSSFVRSTGAVHHGTNFVSSLNNNNNIEANNFAFNNNANTEASHFVFDNNTNAESNYFVYNNNANIENNNEVDSLAYDNGEINSLAYDNNGGNNAMDFDPPLCDTNMSSTNTTPFMANMGAPNVTDQVASHEVAPYDSNFDNETCDGFYMTQQELEDFDFADHFAEYELDGFDPVNDEYYDGAKMHHSSKGKTFSCASRA